MRRLYSGVHALASRDGALIALGAFLAGSAAYIPHAWPLAILGLVPIMHAAIRSTLTRIRAALFSFVFIGTSLGAFWGTIPLLWLGIDSWVASAFVVFLQWSLIVLPFAALMTANLLLFARVASYTHPITSVIFGASLFVLTEYAQMWLYAVIMHGPGIFMGADFSAHMAGYGIAASPFIALAKLGGIFMLSWVAYALSIGLAFMLRRQTQWVILTSTAVLLGTLFMFSALIGSAQDASQLVAASVSIDSHGNTIPPHRKISDVMMLLNPLQDAHPDLGLLVFPESLELLATSTGLTYEWKSSDSRFTIVDSIIEWRANVGTKRSAFYSPRDALWRYADKTFLAPPREYTPYIMARSATVNAISRRLSVVEHPEPAVMRGMTIGGSICLESMSPRHSRKLALKGADILTNGSALGWFNESRWVQRKVSTMNRVRAVETDRYFLVATDSAPAEIIAPSGRIIARTDFGVTGTAVATVGLRDTLTPYVLLGERVLFVPALLMFVSWMYVRSARHVPTQSANRSGTSA